MTILACHAGYDYIQYLNFLYVSQAANKTLKGMFSALSDNVKLC
jgi:hypothetical protein